jgi:hypothetical protein
MMDLWDADLIIYQLSLISYLLFAFDTRLPCGLGLVPGFDIYLEIYYLFAKHIWAHCAGGNLYFEFMHFGRFNLPA